jgi:hypothetical protein
MKGFLNQIREEFASIWTLLNDTELFMKRIGTFDEYEYDFRIWRANITVFKNDPFVLKDIRGEVVALRKALRTSGYDLRMGSKDIEVHSFINDNALRHGFKRMTLALSKSDLFYMTGDANHQELVKYLEKRLGVDTIHGVGEVHFLWYRWEGNVLQLYGADSESKDDFERFRAFADSHKMFLLKKFKNLK